MLTKAEFSRIVALVQKDDERINAYEFMQSSTFNKFLGFATSGFQPVSCTAIELANLVAYQTRQLNGELSGEALEEIWQNRRAFNLVGMYSDEAEKLDQQAIDFIKICDEVLS